MTSIDVIFERYKENIDDIDFNKFGIFGQSYTLEGSKPSLVELCRHCVSEEKHSKALLEDISGIFDSLEFKIFNQKYYDKSKSRILKNFLHDIQSKSSINSEQKIYHSDRRKWLNVVENTELRHYQNECAEIIKNNFRSKSSTLLILPTGAGKTKTVIRSIRDILDENSKPLNILWLVNSKELCKQAEDAIQSSWIEPRKIIYYKQIWLNSIYDSGVKLTKEMFGETHSFTVSTPDTLDPRKNTRYSDFKGLFDIIICDEAHHGVEEQNRIFEMWPAAHRIGITATPTLVSNKKVFNILYSNAAYPKSFIVKNNGKDWKDTKKILIRQEYLSDYGEVIDKCMEHEADKLELNIKKTKWTDQPSSILVAENLTRKMLDEGCKRILLFVDGVIQARSIAGFLRDHGIQSSAVYGDLSNVERSSRINGFSSGHFQVLVSVNILREGIDVPLVDGILIMRKGTKGKALERDDPMFSQMLGRGLRGPKSLGTKNCLVWHITD